MIQKQIIALGGGAFSMEPDNGLLDKYLLNSALAEKPKICFLGTASKDGLEYRKMFYDFYSRMNCEPSHLSLIEPPDDLEKFVLSKDVIHVGGGNTRMLMEKWKEAGLVEIFKKAYNKGIVLTGMSAGAICWFEDGITNPSAGVLQRLECVGLLDGSFCPHYNERSELRTVYHKMIMDGTIEGGFGVDDGAAVHFVNGEPVRVVTSRPGVTACKVRKFRKKISEEKMEAFYLGKISDETKTGITTDTEQKLMKLQVVDEFVTEINKQNVKGIAELMTEDHVFIDSTGLVQKGRDKMTKGWEGYFLMFPDYKIIIEDTTITGNTVGMFGIAAGTFAGSKNGSGTFEIHASWKAVVENGKIKQWQVFADNEPVRKILNTSNV